MVGGEGEGIRRASACKSPEAEVAAGAAAMPKLSFRLRLILAAGHTLGHCTRAYLTSLLCQR